MTPHSEKKIFTPFMETTPREWKKHDQIIKTLEESGCHIGFIAGHMINAINLKAKNDPQKLIKASTIELGFRKNDPYEKIMRKVKSIGSRLCHLSVGPEVRLGYQERGNEILVIATLPYPSTCKEEENCSLFVIRDCPDHKLSIFATPIITINKFDPTKTFWVFPEPVTV